MTNQTGKHDFESRLDRALETAPVVKISEDFALRVAAMAPARVVAPGQAAASRQSVGHRIAWVVAVLLLLAMFVLAPSAGSGGARRWVEFALEIDFVALTLWLGMRSLAASR